MCLTVTVPVKVLKRNRRYYKVVLVKGDGFYSPYMETPIILGKDYYSSSTTIEPDDVTFRRSENFGTARIILEFGSGLFHLYRNKRSAKRNLNLIKYNNPHGFTLIVVEAIVPKGSLVFIDSVLNEEIATNHVKYTRRVI